MGKWSSDFELGDHLTANQTDFFHKHGVIVFRNFLNTGQINICINEIKRIEKEWISEKKDKINGIPIKFGKDEERTIISFRCNP